MATSSSERVHTVQTARPRERDRTARPIPLHDVDLFAEQRLDVATAAQHPQDQDICHRPRGTQSRSHRPRNCVHLAAGSPSRRRPMYSWRVSSAKRAVIESTTRSATSMLLFGLRGSTRCRPGRIRLAVRRGLSSVRNRAFNREPPASALLDLLREHLHRFFGNRAAFARGE